MQLVEFTSKGMYCPPADVYIDPHNAVNKAIITHAHADHARSGHKSYICPEGSLPLIKLRLGRHIQATSYPYGQSFSINGVEFTFFPAGHVVGSAQVRIEYKGEIWVVSGDYKVEADGLTEALEPVKCHCFITESTFGLPIYNWQAQDTITQEIKLWWQENKENQKPSLISAYSLGKAQRLIHMLANEPIGPVYAHSTILKTNEIIQKLGYALPAVQPIPARWKENEWAGALIISSSLATGPWAGRISPWQKAEASGWMALKKFRDRHGGASFVLSDHADWNGIIATIKETEAHKVYTMHGYDKALAQWLQSHGYDAAAVSG
ncbi:MAG TPA: ligase-associated DNA damage response exonuclease [Saprospiraceae bacterium]|nr:ligase-associated DNA damage response exonuclease [Saprospiraceae bacterium]